MLELNLPGFISESVWAEAGGGGDRVLLRKHVVYELDVDLDV